MLLHTHYYTQILNFLNTKRIRRCNTLLFLCFLLALASHAQRIEEDKDMYGATPKQIMQAGDEAYELDRDYYTAMRYYQNALELKPNEVEYIYKYAEAARLAKAYDVSEASYTDLLYIKKDKEFPLTRFWLAQVKQRLGKYTDAVVLYDEFIEKQIGNEDVGTYYIKRAEREKIACTWSKEEAQPQQHVTVQPLGEQVNTPNKEFAPFELGDTLFYSSMDFTKPDDRKARPYSKVMYAVDGHGGQVLEDELNDTNQHAANLAYNVDQNIRAFTICDYTTPYSTEIRCQIYIQRKEYDGSWSVAKPLPDHIQQKDNNYTHPTIGRHADDGQDYLYFVSDQEGGQGKLDIWVVALQADGGYSMPQNLSSINTIEDDITPFFHNTSQTLYYSTEGRKGFGGFDVFKAPKGKTDWLESENMGSPINSSFGDIAFSLNPEGDKGYFASNRKGTTYLEKRFESCCDDLYAVEFDNRTELFVQTFDEEALTSLEGVELELLELRKDGSTVTIDRLVNPTGNDFAFGIELGKTYQVVANRSAYAKSIITVAVPINETNPIEKELYLQAVEVDVEVFVYDAEGKVPLSGATIQILEETTDGLKQTVAERTNETGNDFIFSLRSNKAYIVYATKAGYEIVEDVILSTVNAYQAETIAAEVLMERNSFTDYIPLAIYFDNDYPDVNSKAETTEADYAEMVDDYVARKEEYQLLFTAPMDEEEAFLTAQRYEQFFEREVQKGYEDLIEFTETLIAFLNKGHEVRLQLKGYASPRAEDQYNFRLSARRIVSVENFLRSYKGGILMPYINIGQLEFEQMPFGESTTYFFDDMLDDERNSIYSIGASLERRVEISEAHVKMADDNKSDYLIFTPDNQK